MIRLLVPVAYNSEMPRRIHSEEIKRWRGKRPYLEGQHPRIECRAVNRFIRQFLHFKVLYLFCVFIFTAVNTSTACTAATTISATISTSTAHRDQRQHRRISWRAVGQLLVAASKSPCRRLAGFQGRHDALAQVPRRAQRRGRR